MGMTSELSETEKRLIAKVDLTIDRFLNLFESDKERLRATAILAQIIVERYPNILLSTKKYLKELSNPELRDAIVFDRITKSEGGK